MKALVYTQPNEVCLQERAHPEPAAGEVTLRIESAGICGSDMHAYHGHDPRRQPGLVLGHEFAGVVTASLAPGFAVGDRVTGNPSTTCGVCEHCEQGRSNLCTGRTMVGMTRPGAFAEYMSIAASTLIRLPADMDADTAALTEPAATVLHAVNLAQRLVHRPLPEARVLVQGGGAIGLMSALLLKHYGVSRLSVVELNPLRNQAVRDHVGCEVIDTRRQALAENQFDLVLDCVGAAATRTAAFKAVKTGGVIVHVGLQEWASEIDMRKLTLGEIILAGAFIYTQADLRAAVDALHLGVFGDLGWVERRSLDGGAAAFADLHAGRMAAAKVILKPGGTH